MSLPKKFAGRIRVVLELFGCGGDHRVYERAIKIYNTRSTLVHEEQFQNKDDARIAVCLASSLSRMCLLCSTQLYSVMLKVFDNPDAARLEEIMKRISSEGLDWLIEAAESDK
ncbi:hypothetical protein ACLEEZ_04630 [Lonsdalea quercina]|uniref:hypothetical protein n=1 Tax=Lonsdalea quercina TaxID=71657 RepID=UPI003974FC11